MVGHPRGRRARIALAAIAAFGCAFAAMSLAPLYATAAVAQPAPTQAATVNATAAALANGADKAQLTVDLSGPAQPTAFVLADPARAIVDLPRVAFVIEPPAVERAATKPAARHRHAAKPAGLVASYRFGLLTPDRSRIVIDLSGPAKIVSARVEKAGDKSRLVVELARTDAASFRAAAASARAPTTVAAAPHVVPAPAPGRPTIVIDPGHGGPDTGAIVNGVIEKDVTLAFARMLAAKLEAQGHFNIVMTRSTDVFIPLSERVHIAREASAALMISIHADTLPETADVSGATVYTVSDKASDAYAAKVAAKENAADAAVGVDGQAETADVNDILFDLTRQETRAYSHVFARTLVNYWKVAGRLNKNPQRSAGFVVLKAPDVPSVLLELGYLSNALDSASLTSDDWRGKATTRMAEAIESYFADRNGPAKAAAGVPIALH